MSLITPQFSLVFGLDSTTNHVFYIRQNIVFYELAFSGIIEFGVKVYQAAALVVSVGLPVAEVSEVGLLVVHETVSTAEVSEIGLLVVHEEVPAVELSETGLLVVHEYIAHLYPNDTLLFTENVHQEIWLDSFTTTSVACLHIKPEYVTQTILFTDCVSYEKIHQTRVIYLSLNQTLLFIEHLNVTTGDIRTYLLTDIIDFSEKINSNIRITQTLLFTQTLSSSIKRKKNESLSQTLSFVQTVSENVVLTIPRTLTQTLSFSDTVVKRRVRTIYLECADTLSFIDIVSYNATFNRRLTQIIPFTTDYIRKANPITSAPNIGQESGVQDNRDYFFPVAYLTKVQQLVTIESLDSIITLPPPEWGDSETLSNTMNLKRTMTGRTFTYVRTNLRQKLKYKFKVGRRKSLELRAFLRNNLATTLKVTNYWRSEVYLAKISEIPIEFSFEDSSRTESGRITVELQMEAYKLT